MSARVHASSLKFHGDSLILLWSATDSCLIKIVAPTLNLCSQKQSTQPSVHPCFIMYLWHLLLPDRTISYAKIRPCFIAEILGILLSGKRNSALSHKCFSSFSEYLSGIQGFHRHFRYIKFWCHVKIKLNVTSNLYLFAFFYLPYLWGFNKCFIHFCWYAECIHFSCEKIFPTKKNKIAHFKWINIFGGSLMKQLYL